MLNKLKLIYIRYFWPKDRRKIRILNLYSTLLNRLTKKDLVVVCLITCQADMFDIKLYENKLVKFPATTLLIKQVILNVLNIMPDTKEEDLALNPETERLFTGSSARQLYYQNNKLKLIKPDDRLLN